MGRTNIISNGITITPVLNSIRHEHLLLVEDVRMASGLLRRVYRGRKLQISYEHDDLTESQLQSWLTAHPVASAYSHTDELNVTRTVVTKSIFYQPYRNDSASERRYAISVTIEEV